MRIAISGLLLLLPSAWAQSAATTLHFDHATSARSLQEIVTILRTVADIHEVTVDNLGANLSFVAAPADAAPAAWLSARVDRPDPTPGAMLPPEKAPFGNYVYMVYYLKNARGVRDIQEVITTIRVVNQTQKIYNYTAGAALALRGTPAEIDADEWLIRQLDIPAGSAAPGPHIYLIPGDRNDTLRVFYLPAATSSETIRGMVTALRTTGQMMRVYNYLFARAVPVRAPSTQVEIAARIIDGWQTP